MGKYKAKTIQAGLGYFTNIQEYSGTFRHIQAYSGIIQAYSGIFRTLRKPATFRTLAYSELGACSKSCQTSTMKHFGKNS